MGKVLLPGTRRKLLMVEFPSMPSVDVERLSVTLPIAMVMMEGLGMKALPLRLGVPAGALRLTLTSVTLKPERPLRPIGLSIECFCEMLERGRRTFVGRSSVERNRIRG